nr:heme-binding domain-containing protein [Halarcobacter anaerophilus]
MGKLYKRRKNKKLKEIFRTAYAAMPLNSYKWIHKDAELTRSQRTMIREWTGVKK